MRKTQLSQWGKGLVFAGTVFLGAFLLFQVQPLVGRFLLPWFGGTPEVWTTCMLFFQVFLLGGYAYAHAVARMKRPRLQAVLHIALLILALAFLPIVPKDIFKPTGANYPVLRILLICSVTVGLPYLLLSADLAADCSVVCTGVSSSQSVSAVRPVEYGVTLGAGQLSVCVRAADDPPGYGDGVVARFYDVRGAVRDGGADEPKTDRIARQQR